MRIVWSARAMRDYRHWQSRNPKAAAKIETLISEIERTPFTGTGKPEPLSADLQGFWSRRISQEHRLVYRVSGKRGQDQTLEIASCRYHY